MATERKKKERKGPRATPGYMTTFGDMMNLLLTFFILLLTTATIQGREFKLILSAFTGSFGMMPGGLTLQKGKLAEMGFNIETLPSTQKARKMARAKKKATHVFQPEIESKKIRIREDERGLVITLMNDAYFAKAEYEVNKKIKVALDKITKMLKDDSSIKNKVRIEGHTDTTPLKKDKIPRNNWELSTMRATGVVKYLIDNGVIPKKRFSAAGMGQYRPLPGNSNDTPEDRSLNRRIEIILLWEEANL